MNNKDFTRLLQNPQAITHEQTEVVKSIIDEFPYFQSARALYLKGLKDQNSFKYNQELKITAAYTSDRSILFDFITSDSFIQNEISQSIQQNTALYKDIDVSVEDVSVEDVSVEDVSVEDVSVEDVSDEDLSDEDLSVNKSMAIDDVLKQQIKDTEGVLDPALFQPITEHVKKSAIPKDSKQIENTNQTSKIDQTSAPLVLNLGKPLQFDKKETHSFNEWLKISHFKPIQREDYNTKQEIKADPNKSKKAKKFELIDKFITKNPKIKPSKTITNKRNLAKAQLIQTEALMTETLARIYVEQKNYKKAIQSYNILSLKYPEKSSFFANQIKAVEQLQEQNN